MLMLLRPRCRGQHGMLRRGVLSQGGLLLVGFCVLAVAAPAENLTGTWMGLIPSQRRDIELKIVQNGAALSGKLYREGASSPIIEGKVDERGEVEFVVETREQAGNQVNIVGVPVRGCCLRGRYRPYPRALRRPRRRERRCGAGSALERHARTRPSAPFPELYARASVLRTDGRLAVQDQGAESWKGAGALWVPARITAAFLECPDVAAS